MIKNQYWKKKVYDKKLKCKNGLNFTGQKTKYISNSY